MTDREELRRLAQAATPGPWRVGTPPPNGEQTIGTLGGLMVAVATTGWGVNSKDNADFITAANPAAVIELLDEIERLRRHIDALHGKGDVRHNYNGLCPDERQPDSRDDECPACRLLGISAEKEMAMRAQTAPSVPAPIEGAKYMTNDWYYAEGWNDCRHAMLDAQENNDG